MSWSRRLAYALVALATSTALATIAHRAHAHSAGLSKAEYVVAGDVVTAELTFARSDVDEISPSDIVRGIDVRGDGQPCPGALETAAGADQDGFGVRARFVCPSVATRITIDLTLLARLPPGHRQIARSVGADGVVVDALLSQGHELLTFEATEQATPRAAPTKRTPSFAEFLTTLAIVGAAWFALRISATMKR